MNCHTAVQNGPEYGTAEILKIYASSGFNPISNKTPEFGQYFKSDVPAEKRLEIYKRWLKEANKDKKTVSEIEINSQLAAVKPLIGKPINWIKIHNLPDHVYFNHSQHVKVGKQQCQTCHGNIQEMPEVYQFTDLSMGWCVNCHRETKVDFYNKESKEGNKFYSIYEKFHNDIKNHKMDSVTVEKIGGTECQKCHY
jgi:hypothetical protein